MSQGSILLYIIKIIKSSLVPTQSYLVARGSNTLMMQGSETQTYGLNTVN